MQTPRLITPRRARQNALSCGSRKFLPISPVRSVAHLEPSITCHRQLAQLNSQNLCSRGTLLTPGPQLRNRQRRSLGLHFNTAVTQVADPAPQAEVQCAPIAAGSKADPLDPPVDQQPPAFEEGLQPSGLGSVDEPPGFGVGSAASASRHREQIVEELAQCR